MSKPLAVKQIWNWIYDAGRSERPQSQGAGIAVAASHVGIAIARPRKFKGRLKSLAQFHYFRLLQSYDRSSDLDLSFRFCAGAYCLLKRFVKLGAAIGIA